MDDGSRTDGGGDASRPARVEVQTNAVGGLSSVPHGQGSFGVELYWREAPRTCRNFVELAQRGYYDGTVFHRVIHVLRSACAR